MAYQLCNDLGFNVPKPQPLQDVLDGKLPEIEEEEDPLRQSLPIYNGEISRQSKWFLR